MEGFKDPDLPMYFVGNFTNSSGLVAIEELTEVITTLPPEITTNVIISSGDNWVQVDNVGLRANGYVWGYISEKYDNLSLSPSGAKPTPI